MKILLIGSGGREHALALAISKSQSCSKLYAAPGNPGIFQLAQKAKIDINNKHSIIEFCKFNEIELVVIGPEQPLAEGLADILNAEGVSVFGPSKYASQLESSKEFSKIVMQKNNIPTAAYSSFANGEREKAHIYIDMHTLPIVIKADGLAAGKGVVIASTYTEAHNAIDSMFDGEFGKAGSKVVIEEFLHGTEASVFVISDGKDYLILPPSQDHKRIGNNDTGKNTGGMGAFAPAEIVNNIVMQKVENNIIIPLLNALEKNGNPYRGCLYIGLMIHNNEPNVVEFNVRFGDPESQAVLPLIDGDIAKLFYTAASGKIEKYCVKIRENLASACVVIASEGYPDSYQKGFEIQLPEFINDNEIIYHAGTTIHDDKLITAGGRVFGVTAVSENLSQAIESAYKLVDKIHFDNMYYRNDIGKKGLPISQLS